MAQIAFVKNITGREFPPRGDDGKPTRVVRYNGNDGYSFEPGETKALSMAEAEFLCRTEPCLKMMGFHGEKGQSITQQITGTAKALETFGIQGDEKEERQPKKR